MRQYCSPGSLTAHHFTNVQLMAALIKCCRQSFPRFTDLGRGLCKGVWVVVGLTLICICTKQVQREPLEVAMEK